MAVTQICGVAWEDTSPWLMARIVDGNNNILTQSGVSSISYTVTDMNNPDTILVGPTTLTVAQVVFNSLQTDSRWTKDAVGYNLGYALPAVAIPEGNRVYNVDFHITPTVGVAFPAVFLITTLKRRYATP